MAEKKPSPSQLDALQHMAADAEGRLYRMPGGFWTTRSTPMRERVGDSRHFKAHDVPAWSIGTQTLRSLERLGWARRTNTHPEAWRDERELTDVGRALATA